MLYDFNRKIFWNYLQMYALKFLTSITQFYFIFKNLEFFYSLLNQGITSLGNNF